MNKGLELLNSIVEWRANAKYSREGVKQVLLHLGNPQDLLKTVHIGGTNGKGSTSCAVASILAQSGAKVGLYTSPHLIEINERIVINGWPIALEELGDRVYEMHNIALKLGIELSFFEILTLTAFKCFKDHNCDWAVIEVGLGGRLDATNVINKPQACAITSVAFDHMSILGDTLAKIAFEKSGIIKDGVPLVLGQIPTEGLNVILDQAKGLNAPIFVYKQDFSCQNSNNTSNNYQYYSKKLSQDTILNLQPSLFGQHQVINMSVATTLGLILGQTTQACESGIRNVFWPARLERLQMENHQLVLDCAHNSEGIDSLVEYIKNNNFKELALCVGFLADKDWKSSILKLAKHTRHLLIAKPDSERAQDPQTIVDFLSSNGISSQVINDYWLDLQRTIKGHDLIITGSMYLVGLYRKLLKTNGILQDRALW